MGTQLEDKRMNKAAFWPAIIILALFITSGVIWREPVGNFMTTLLYGMADYLGWYINLLSLAFIILGVVFVAVRYGDVVIGGKDVKPAYSMPIWCAMSICSGIGTGLLFWAMGEPMYHFMTTPTAVGTAGSRDAAIFAVAQAMWDWSFVQYCMYAICGAAFAVICFNRKKSLSFNSIIECAIGKKIPWLNTLLTAVVIFCIMGATSNSMGVGLMQIGAGLEAAFGVPQSRLIWLLAAIFIGCVFITSCVTGISKGLKYVSTCCMYFFFFLMGWVLIFGNTQFISKIGSESIGYIIDNFGKMTVMTNVLTTNDSWFADWIVQYWASFIVYAPVIGMFLARMGRGRTVRTFMLVQILVPSFFCIVWIAIFGGQVIHLQTSEAFDVWNAVNTSGMQATVFQIIGTLPMSNFVTIMFLLCIVMSFSTLADPMASCVATLACRKLEADAEPPMFQKILAGCILCGTAYTLVATGGINSVKGMFTLVGLLQSIILIMCAIVLFKYCKKCYDAYFEGREENGEWGVVENPIDVEE